MDKTTGSKFWAEQSKRLKNNEVNTEKIDTMSNDVEILKGTVRKMQHRQLEQTVQIKKLENKVGDLEKELDRKTLVDHQQLIDGWRADGLGSTQVASSSSYTKVTSFSFSK